MQITVEAALAVLELLDAYAIAEQRSPSMPVGDVLQCACRGPLPECHCKQRARLVAEFRAAVEADSLRRMREQGIGHAAQRTQEGE